MVYIRIIFFTAQQSLYIIIWSFIICVYIYDHVFNNYYYYSSTTTTSSHLNHYLSEEWILLCSIMYVYNQPEHTIVNYYI